MKNRIRNWSTHFLVCRRPFTCGTAATIFYEDLTLSPSASHYRRVEQVHTAVLFNRITRASAIGGAAADQIHDTR